MILKCIILLFLGTEVFAGKVKYENYKVYAMTPSNNDHLVLLETLENNQHVNIWLNPKRLNEVHTIMVSPNYQNTFEELYNDLSLEVVIKDVECAINEEKRKILEATPLNRGEVRFDRYMRYIEIQNYLERIALQYKEIVSFENYGLSYEKRNLTLVKISTGFGLDKPTILVDAGIHAREWLAPAQALYIINQLIKNGDNRRLIENVNWIIIPLINPDGYEYTHTTDRLWRKTRSKGIVCDGVDANRNFDFHWSEEGGDRDECSENYAGPKAFSEPETTALSRVILKYARNTKLYLSIHTPLLALLHPWGYTSDSPPNRDELRDLGLSASDAIYAVNGTRYKVGSSVEIFTHTAGSSRDWAYGFANISLSYTVELPPGPHNVHQMPPENILRVVTETFEGIKVFHNYVNHRRT
ncbi:carboxypeptidase B-like [Photinus pyralis]|nr:carboxypeptidase B-like [Photinus pyralis]